MTKAELKAKWGEVADTDTLVDEMAAFLRKNHWNHHEHGICTVLDTFFANKAGLIALFKQHPKYDNLRIVTECEFEAEDISRHVRDLVNSFPEKLNSRDLIYSKQDADGKTEQQHRAGGLKAFRISKRQMSDEEKTAMQGKIEALRGFIRDGYSFDSIERHENFLRAINKFSVLTADTIDEETAEELNSYLPVRGKKTDLSEGIRTSRAFNRMCDMFGLTKSAEYNKLYAQYSDTIKGKKRVLKFVASLNPVDYLGMSYGVSWTSCHCAINDNNHSVGSYCGGCLSYMLDCTSIITFVQMPGTHLINDGKLYRNMFHWNGSMLLQSRIYPQGNDGAVDLYALYRGYVQKIMAEALGVSNKWIVSRSLDKNAIRSNGNHYRDYMYNNSCNYSYLKESKDTLDTGITIGHTGYCLCCGEVLERSGQISHGSCSPASSSIDW